MGKTFSVSSFEEMSKASGNLKNLSTTYTEIYKKLMDKASTMGSAWEGADNQAFVTQIQGFTQELQAMAEKLLTASQALDKQRANYIARQDDNIAQVQKLIN